MQGVEPKARLTKVSVERADVVWRFVGRSDFDDDEEESFRVLAPFPTPPAFFFLRGGILFSLLSVSSASGV